MKKIRLKMGSFYEDKQGGIWCCFKVGLDLSVHCQARCVRISDDRVEYFYLDGRYDHKGLRELCLLRELAFSEAKECSHSTRPR